MLYQGQNVQLIPLSEGLIELRFDRQSDVINKLDAITIQEFGEATAVLAAMSELRGVLVTSAKDCFIVGADITEFGDTFKQTAEAITAEIWGKNQHFMAFEDLPVPTVVAINGFALGGGLEMALSAGFRVMANHTQVGVPEVKLGLFPGFGGTVRLARLAGPAAAIDWVVSGKPANARTALAAGVVDAVADVADLRATALDWLNRAIAGEVDWRARQASKRSAVALDAVTLTDIFAKARQQTVSLTARHQPAARAAVDMMEAACIVPRDAAIRLEVEAFGRIAQTQAAHSLIQAFLNEQVLKKLFKRHLKQAQPVKQGAVVGAGIMGGGIAYTSVLRGIPVRLKDIAQAQLDLGMQEARKQLAKLFKSGRKTEEQAGAIAASILPSLTYNDFDQSDLVIEAVVENMKVKHAVLTELESVVRPDTIIATNTSSLRIDDIVTPLLRPENFVGMHFFNPVPVMPLVEVIKGSRSSDTAVSTAVGYCVAMGKTPIVVKDCPGFLVNRILTAYMRGFLQLVNDGADFVQVDRVMEAFGWPMGPAYLEDVVGMDTGSHVSDVISQGYAERMPPLERDALRLMAQKQRFGQKNGIGFYQYEIDPNGKPKRSVAADSHALLATLQIQGQRNFTDQEIVDRMMIPMIIEAAHALEEDVVGSPAELDTALLLGIGFPAYLGGACKYADWLGLATVVAKADALADLGPGYVPTARMRAMAASGQTFY